MTSLIRSLSRRVQRHACSALPWRQRGARLPPVALLVAVLSASSSVVASGSVAAGSTTGLPLSPGERPAHYRLVRQGPRNVAAYPAHGFHIAATPAGLRLDLSRTAALPMHVDYWAQQAWLTAGDAAGGDNAGHSVALSGDTAVVGSPGNNGGTGAAYVFVHRGTRWIEQARLTAGDGAAGDQFGYSVALSGDVVVVGAPFKDTQTGSAYVFVRRRTAWHQQARLTAGDTAVGSEFGLSVAFSGITAIVGAPQKNSNTGAAYVFVSSGTHWHQRARLTAGDAAAIDDFGFSVALSGNTALIGASQKNNSSGAAYVFVSGGTRWRQQARLAAGDSAPNDEFGTSVSLSGDTAVVGAPGKNIASGAVYVLVRDGTAWRQQARLTAGDTSHDENVGLSVALDGSILLCGAPGQNGNTGTAYVFMRSGTRWSQQARLPAGEDSTGDGLGTSVALGSNTALIGAPGKSNSSGAVQVLVQGGTGWGQQATITASDSTARDQFSFSMAASGASTVVGAPSKNDDSGAAYVFAQGGANWRQQDRLSASDGAVGDRFGFSVATSGATAVVGALNKNGGAGAAYVFVRSATGWLQQVKLTAGDGAGGDQFGFSVAVSGNTVLVGAPGKNDGAGAAYVFVHSGARWNQQVKIIDDAGAGGDQFGFSVSLNGDTALVGAPGTNSGTGTSYLFTRSGTSWRRQAGLTASDSLPGDEFGTAVSLDGDTALIGAGAPFNTRAGAAYVFVRNGNGWRQQARLTAGDGVGGDEFGLSVALSGSTAMVGAPFNSRTGAAYLFVHSGTSWRQQAKLTADDRKAGDKLGLFVVLTGNTALVAAPGKNSSSGVVYEFVRSALDARPT